MLELLAHVHPGELPGAHHVVRIHVPPGASVERVRAERLPGWDTSGRKASRAFGDRWYDEKRSIALVVPAVPARPFGCNILLNAAHPEFGQVRSGPPEPVPWDARWMGERWGAR